MCVCVCRLLNLVKRAVAMYCICADPCVCVYASFSCVSCMCLCVLTCVFVFWVTVSPLTPHSVPQRTRKLWASICELWETGLVGSHIHTHTKRKEWHTVFIPYQSWQDGSCFLCSLCWGHISEELHSDVCNHPLFFCVSECARLLLYLKAKIVPTGSSSS